MANTVNTNNTRAVLIAGLLALGGCAGSLPDIAMGTPTGPAPTVRAKTHMISAANPLAAKAGLEILEAGGSAVDAAIAASLVLGLVEPQSSGIGGGGFMVSFNGANGEVSTWDGRETAPDGVRADMFMRGGEPMKFSDARLGGMSVGVPGLLAMLEMAHAEEGKLEWKRLFDPAIELAEKGFAISPRLAKMIAAADDLKTFRTTRRYFFRPDGTPKGEGEILVNRELAETYRTIANGGASAFYLGSIGYDVAETAREAIINPSTMTGNDTVAYRAQKRPPVCGPYREMLVCSVGPPSSGGVAVLQILGMLQEFDIARTRPGSLRAAHLVAEASKLAFADRDTYIADPRFVPWPEGLIAPDYLKARAGEINPSRAAGSASPGMPGMMGALELAPSGESGGVSTTHISVIDSSGNAVALTSSIESAFGSRLMVRGFLLNNQLTDFSFRPEINGAPVANQVQPRARPRSSMAPVLVFDSEGRVVAAIGSPGGSSIIGYVAGSIVKLVDWNLSPGQAVSMGHFLSRGDAVELEKGTPAEKLKSALERIGHKTVLREMTSGLHMVGNSGNGLVGAADPRREGVALGD